MWQKVKNKLIYWMICAVVNSARLFPHAWALGCGALLGRCFHAVVPKERKRAWRHLAAAFPGLPEKKRRAATRSMFAALGRNAFELFKMMGYSSAAIVRRVEKAEGLQHMCAAREKGRGVICLTAHLGNWEILPIFMRQQGWPTAVVAQVLYDPRLDEMLNGFRRRHQIVVIQRRQATRDIIRCLKQNHLLGVLNDQDTSVDSRFAPFFNQPAKTPIGIFRLARKLGTPVVPVFIARQPNDRHHIYIEPALTLPHTGDEETDLQASAQLCNQVIEKYVRRFPEQWVWFHQRWKSRPEQAREEGGR